MRELDTKVKTLQSKLSELLINYNTELRILGYNVFVQQLILIMTLN